MRQRLVDFAFLLGALATLLGGYYVFERVRYHNQMDAQLIQVLQNIQKAQSAPR